MKWITSRICIKSFTSRWLTFFFPSYLDCAVETFINQTFWIWNHWRVIDWLFFFFFFSYVYCAVETFRNQTSARSQSILYMKWLTLIDWLFVLRSGDVHEPGVVTFALKFCPTFWLFFFTHFFLLFLFSLFVLCSGDIHEPGVVAFALHFHSHSRTDQ